MFIRSYKNGLIDVTQPDNDYQIFSRLEHFPITFFASVMGLTGLAICWLRFEQMLKLPTSVGLALLFIVSALFLFITAVYLSKWIRHPEAVSAEFNNPVRINFFPAFSISLLLLSIAYSGLQPVLSRSLWFVGTLLHIGFTFKLMHIWFHQEFKVEHLTPPWFIPVVGNILVPVVGVQYAPADVSWFFYSIGLVFWLVLLSIVFNRIIFHNPLPAKLLPTLFILIAPPAVAFIAYIKLTGDLDVFARILYFNALFTTLLLFFMVDRFKRLPFFISWWAYTFPLDAITLATLLMYHHTGLLFFKFLSIVFLILASLMILVVLYKTLRAAFKREICLPE